MKGLEELVDKINFKKAIKLYVIISIILILLCGISIAYITRDKIAMAIDYEKVSDSFKDNAINEELKTQLEQLSKSSNDIINVIVIDRNGSVLYKSNSNLIGNSNSFQLRPYEPNKMYFQDNMNENIIYKVVRDENIILNRDYINNHDKVVSDIDEDFYYEQDLGTKKIDLINFMINRDTQNRAFVIREVSTIPYARQALKATALVLGIIFMVYWIGLALWAYKDANRKRNNPALWGLLVLITNLGGIIIYTLYKQNNKICTNCGSMQNKDNIYCTSCGNKINETCTECGRIINKEDNFCSRCGSKI